MFKSTHIYYRFKKGEVQATHVESGKVVNKTCSALAHSRTLMGDFFEIERCLKDISAELLPKTLFSLSPIAIVQLLEASEGGYTNVEIRAFREAILGTGARRVYFPESKSVLSSSEIKGLSFRELPNV
ncbi:MULTISPECIES: hypothetical protein [Vibrio]|uniref:hypothetical protein n=1 Tax=Vibrio TaxID=662 RepID=UPI00084B99C1|nr:hypothetical protein [Vibrio parahaemolyticus]MBO0154602.1 hypothetical protein [Vibrio parahaemolyticus]MDF5168841.1 hypothetical protein [Vibrio parahaemolyticus]MDF5612084.1 hypothetical protein [Vibrio parahaemolyticus]MDG2737603.1 hypothetical protein [Vibrio parahaemolyticus]ODX93764.1 hypothetical protein BBM92_01345 [Vibrio parahaemolyticus]